MKKYYSITIFILCVFQLNIWSQANFDQYKTLQSEGPIPLDFSSLTFEKIQEDLKEDQGNLSGADEKLFLKHIHYGIDDILHSGMTVYGDEVSLYVRSVAEKLLKKDPITFSKLRFYTIKSNESNAFSTDQGIIFVTTGLISQLTNEAQLAFILAHEISHYMLQHVVVSFTYQLYKRDENGRKIRDLSTYSKEKELEADAKALELYQAAGYPKNEIYSTFDVMMYSYLPFEEMEFPKTYFNSPQMYIPENLFTNAKFAIKAVENYDDSKSSHPNIKKRKEEINRVFDMLPEWPEKTEPLGDEKFKYIRTICRFESIRTDIIDAEYVKAIYSIFILEKEFPNSVFLKKMKAHSLLGLVHFEDKNSDSEIHINVKNEFQIPSRVMEGDIARLYFFFDELNHDGRLTLAIRQIYDLRKSIPNDPHIEEIYSYLLKKLAYSNTFNLTKYSHKTFNDVANEYATKMNTSPIDTVDTKVPEDKYSRITGKNNPNNMDNFDSTKFYLYALSDIIVDPEFMEKYRFFRTEMNEKERKKAEYEKLSDRKKKKVDKSTLGIDRLIVVEPSVYSYRKGQLSFIKSEKLKRNFSKVMEDAAEQAVIQVFTIDRNNLDANGTEMYNQRSILFNYLQHIAKNNHQTIFSVDFELLKEIEKKYNTDKIMFTWVDHTYTSRIDGLTLVGMIIAFPSLPIYLPLGILTGHDTQMNVIVVNINEGTTEMASNYYFKDTPKKYHLGAHMVNIFTQLKYKK